MRKSNFIQLHFTLFLLAITTYATHARRDNKSDQEKKNNQKLDKIIKIEAESLLHELEKAIDNTNFGFLSSTIQKKTKILLKKEIPTFEKKIRKHLEDYNIYSALSDKLADIDLTANNLSNPYIAGIRLLMFEEIMNLFNKLIEEKPNYKSYIEPLKKNIEAYLEKEKTRMRTTLKEVAFIENGRWDKDKFVKLLS